MTNPSKLSIAQAVQFAAVVGSSGVELSIAREFHKELNTVLTDADLRDIPIIPNIDAAILAAIEADGHLRMSYWHTCETTHCRGGWAILCAGEAGKRLEDKFGSAVAAALIYHVSRPGKRIPDFYASNAEAMADIKACAAEPETS